MIKYKINDKIKTGELELFFQGWKSPPSLIVRRKFLKGSELVITARKDGKLVGFLTAISDDAMIALISLVEVLKPHQGKGIGKHLMELAIAHFKGYYQIILITDTDKGAFYKKLGFTEIYGMQIQNFIYGRSKSKKNSKKDRS